MDANTLISNSLIGFIILVIVCFWIGAFLLYKKDYNNLFSSIVLDKYTLDHLSYNKCSDKLFKEINLWIIVEGILLSILTIIFLNLMGLPNLHNERLIIVLLMVIIKMAFNRSLTISILNDSKQHN